MGGHFGQIYITQMKIQMGRHFGQISTPEAFRYARLSTPS